MRHKGAALTTSTSEHDVSPNAARRVRQCMAALLLLSAGCVVAGAMVWEPRPSVRIAPIRCAGWSGGEATPGYIEAFQEQIDSGAVQAACLRRLRQEGLLEFADHLESDPLWIEAEADATSHCVQWNINLMLPEPPSISTMFQSERWNSARYDQMSDRAADIVSEVLHEFDELAYKIAQQRNAGTAR